MSGEGGVGGSARGAGEAAGSCVGVGGRLCRTNVGSIMIFFFFQAEDGIRDYKVTGVQTCALPISDWDSAAKSETEAFGKFFGEMLDRGVYLPPSQYEAAFLGAAHSEDDVQKTIRSEERRVGKECRSRWSPYH